MDSDETSKPVCCDTVLALRRNLDLFQLRPGMDLSKVVLPTFILEPRSFLEKLADFYYHIDLLGRYAIVGLNGMLLHAGMPYGP